MDKDQIQAAKIVIGKYIPDLKAIELSGNEDKPVAIKNIYEWQEPR